MVDSDELHGIMSQALLLFKKKQIIVNGIQY